MHSGLPTSRALYAWISRCSREVWTTRDWTGASGWKQLHGTGLPRRAGHALVAWDNRLVALGGYTVVRSQDRSGAAGPRNPPQKEPDCRREEKCVGIHVYDQASV